MVKKNEIALIRFVAKAIAVGFFLCALDGCYYVKQGDRLLKYQISATSNTKLIAKPSTPPDIKQFLEKVEEIRRFAFDTIGLKKNKNFSCFVQINRKYLIDNIYAAKPDTFAQYFWHYPFFGAMPYKGFLEKKDAEKEAARLRKQGYDVFIGEVDGFSSLGFLKDPVYSFMKDFGPYSLSSLIFHELTHSTLFIKNQSQFNEEIATFVGTVGGLRYVADKFGSGSEAYKRALLSVNDSKRYHALMRSLYLRLDSAYRSEKSVQSRIAAKERIIGQFKQDIAKDYDSLFKTKAYTNLPRSTINNAIILINRTYTSDLDLYYKFYEQCGGDLKKTLAALGTLRTMKGDPKENIRTRLLKKAG
jgi:predicted aminopeptidase